MSFFLNVVTLTKRVNRLCLNRPLSIICFAPVKPFVASSCYYTSQRHTTGLQWDHCYANEY